MPRGPTGLYPSFEILMYAIDYGFWSYFCYTDNSTVYNAVAEFDLLKPGGACDIFWICEDGDYDNSLGSRGRY
mgnify:CR=1 FL=1